MAEDTSSGTEVGSRIAYLGGRNVIYDLTGSDPRFKRGTELENYHPDELVVFEAGQVHTFQIPAFLGSIRVERYNPDSNNWIVVDKDETHRTGWCELEIDNESMSKAC